jgi:hypothetical protein
MLENYTQGTGNRGGDYGRTCTWGTQNTFHDTGSHPPSYSMGTGGSFPRGKAAEEWTFHLHLVPKLRICAAVPEARDTSS